MPQTATNLVPDTVDAPLPGAQRRLLIVAPGIPHPTEGGSSVVFYEYTAGLKRAGFTILNLLLLQPDQGNDAQLAAYRAGLEEDGRFEVAVARSTNFVRSTRGRHRFDRVAIDAVRAQILDFKPDVVVALDIVAAWAVADLPIARKVVWLGDLHFETYWYATLYARREGNVSLKYMAGTWFYSLLWKRVYRNVLKRFDAVIACAKSSERALASIGIRATYIPYAWPVLSAKPRDRSRRSAIPSFLFFGGLGGLGSRSAFHLMMTDIYPRLRARLGAGGFRFVICGRGALPPWAQHEIANMPEIDFRGYVEDLDGVMDECHAMLAPIDVPVGNRTRILTAITRRLPVVAHSNTALGNPELIDGQTCYLASRPEEFVDRMERLLKRPEEAERIVEAAYRSYEAHFAIEPAVGALIDRIVGA